MVHSNIYPGLLKLCLSLFLIAWNLKSSQKESLGSSQAFPEHAFSHVYAHGLLHYPVCEWAFKSPYFFMLSLPNLFFSRLFIWEVFFLLLLVPGYWSQYFCLHILLTKTTKEASPALVTLQVRWNKGKPLCRSLRELEGSKHKTQFFENWAHYCPLLHQQPETCVGCHLMAATNLVSGRWWAGNLNCHCALTQCSSSFLSLAFPSLL